MLPETYLVFGLFLSLSFGQYNNFVPNCDERDLMTNNVAMLYPSYDALVATDNWTKTFFPNRKRGDIGDAFKFTFLNLEVTRRLYNNPSVKNAWNVTTLESCAKWATLLSDAHACSSNRSCCPSSDYAVRTMQYHNGQAGSLIIQKLGFPLRTEAEYAQLVRSYLDDPNRTEWFSPSTPEYVTEIVAEDKMVYYLPRPSNYDLYELDDTPEFAYKVDSTDESIQNHHFHNSEDVDWVSFCAVKGINYTIQTSLLGEESDTLVQLYDQSGVSLLASNDNVEGGLNSELFFVSSVDSTLHVMKVSNKKNVTSFSKSGYQLVLRGQTCANKYNRPSFGGNGTIDAPTCPTGNCDALLVPQEPVSIGSVYSRTLGLTINHKNNTLDYDLRFMKDGSEVGKWEITLARIVEIDPAYNEICQTAGTFAAEFSNQTLNIGGLPINNVNFTANLENCATFALATYLFDDASTIQYANEDVKILPNTFKMTVEVRDWPFQHPDNKLLISIGLKSNIPINSQIVTTYPNSPDIQNVAINTPQDQWNLRFLRNSINDGVVTQCSVTSDIDSLTGSSSSVRINLKMKSFTKYVLYDPDFSLLLGNDNQEDEQQSSGKEIEGNLTTVVIIVVCIAAAVVVAASTAIYFYRRKQLSERQRMVKKASHSDIHMKKNESHP